MSRPRKDKEHKLSKVVIFRVTESALQKLEDYSEICGKAIGVMVRDKLFTGIAGTALPQYIEWFVGQKFNCCLTEISLAVLENEPRVV